MTTFDVIGVGENSVDHVYRLPELPTADAKLPILDQRVSFGGQVATAVCACASLGLRAKYAGAFGSDENGVRIRRELARRGVDIADAPVRDAPNRHALVLIDDRTGDRVVLWQRDAALTLRAADMRPETVAHTRLLHVDAIDEDAAIAVARLARDARVWVTSDIDRVTERTGELFDAVDVAIVAEHVPEAMTGEANIEHALRTLRTRHAGWLCVTLGTRGAVLLDGDRLHVARAFPVNAVDTTGAGDVFRAGFIYALLRGDSPPDILRFANAAAAVSCTRAGAIDGVPSLQDVERVLTGTHT